MLFRWIAVLALASSPAVAGEELAVSVFEDKSGRLTVSEVLGEPPAQWRRITAREASFGFSTSTFWLKFRPPEELYEKTWMLEVPSSYLERASLFAVRKDTVLREDNTGLGVPVRERGESVLKVGFPTFRIPPEDRGTEFLLAVSSRHPVTAQLHMLPGPDFAFYHWSQVLVLGIFFGGLLVGAVYNGFMAVTLRSRLYGAYAFFLIAICAGFMAHEGFTTQLFWPSSSWWAVREIHVFNGLAVVFYAVFVREFLGSRRNFPWLDMALLTLVGISTLRMVWALFELYAPVIQAGFIAVGLVNVMVLLMAARALARGVEGGRFFLLSTVAFNFFAIGFMLQESGAVWFGEFMRRGPHLGTAIEVVLLSLALADRVRKINLANSRQRAALLHAEKMSVLGKMAGEIAHEINNPLAIIHGNAVLIRKHELPAPVLESAVAIENTANRITRVVKSIRALARNSSQDPFVPTPLGTVVQDALALCEERVRKTGVNLQAPQIAPELMILCRCAEIIQVIVNLINNAFDAVELSEDRRIRIEVRERGGHVELSVADSGSGVPVHLRPRLQEPFFTTKEAGKGLGLGLSIARSIVDSHGGRLWLDDSCLETRFVFTVPAARELAR